MPDDDRNILIAALESAARDYRALQPTPSLLGPDPPREMMDALAAQIDRCETYRAVAGKVLFSGGSGPVLDSHSLASRLFSKGVRWGNDIPSAADWLIRLMTTRETTGLFKAAIWGHSSPSNPGRAASPIYSDLICDRHNGLMKASTRASISFGFSGDYVSAFTGLRAALIGKARLMRIFG